MNMISDTRRMVSEIPNELIDGYRKLKEYIDRSNDKRLYKLAENLERKIILYVSEHEQTVSDKNNSWYFKKRKAAIRREGCKMKGMKNNFGRMASKIKDLTEDLTRYNKRVLRMNHENAERLARFVAREFKKGYEGRS